MSNFVAANSATSGGANVTSLTVPLPPGWVPGQFCAVAGTINDSAAATLVGPAGWMPLDSAPVTVSSSECGAWYRILESGDSNPVLGITGGSFKASGATATYSSVDATAPIAAIGTRGTRAVSSTSTVAPSVTTTAANQRIVGIFLEKSTSASSVTDPSGMTRRAGVWGSGGGQVSALIEDEVIASAGASGTRTATYNVASGAGYAILFALLDGTPPPPEPGTVVHAWVGAQTVDGVTVVARTLAATDVRLAVSTSSGMTSPVYSSAEVPDSDGYVRLTITGLSDGTAYWWQLEDTPAGGSPELIGDVGRASTLPDGPASYSFAFAACQTNNTSSVALDDMLAWDPLFFLHLGDLHYRDPNSTSAAVHRGYIEAQILGASPLAEVLRTIPTYYTRSDHDTTGDNGDNNTTNGLASNAAYRQVVPHPPLAAPTDDSLNYSFVVGRIRFIVLDMRSHYKSTGADAQSSSKSMLGSAQKAWLKAELIEAEPVKVILSDTGWIGAASLLLGTDKWWAYDDERTEIGAYIAAQGLSGSVVMLMGDNHSLLSDDGTGNLWGGFACWGAAPLANISGGRYITDHQQSYSPFPQEAVRQYGRVTVADDGDSITLNFSGWDALNGLERVNGELVVDLSITGPLAGTLPAVQGSATGTVTVIGTLAGTLPAATGSATGNLRVTGQLAGTLPALQGTASGVVHVTGALAGTLPALTASLAGTVSVHGAVAGVLPAVTGSAVGSVTVSGSVAGTLPAVTGSAVGAVTVSAQLAGNLPALTGSLTGNAEGGAGSLNGILPPLTGAFAGTLAVTGTFASSLPALTGALAGEVEGVNGTLAGALPALSGGFTATIAAHGALAGTLPSVTGSFTGQVAGAGGFLDGTFPALTGAFTARTRVTGLAAAVLPALQGSATGTVTVAGILSGVLPAATGSMAGQIITPHGALSGTLPALTGAFTGTSDAIISGRASLTSASRNLISMKGGDE